MVGTLKEFLVKKTRGTAYDSETCPLQRIVSESELVENFSLYCFPIRLEEEIEELVTSFYRNQGYKPISATRNLVFEKEGKVHEVIPVDGFPCYIVVLENKNS
jgi:hypothetical protein